MTARNRLIQLIHVGARNLFGDDQELRHAWQLNLTGKGSCAEMTDQELERLVAELRREQALRPPGAIPPQARLIYLLWNELDRLGALHHHTHTALEHFIHHQIGRDEAPERLDHKEANQVIEALKAWVRRERIRVAES